jgi:hypothetical protein
MVIRKIDPGQLSDAAAKDVNAWPRSSGWLVGCTLKNSDAGVKSEQGPMLGFLEYFRRKVGRKNRRFFAQTTASFCKNMSVTVVFLRKTPIFCENANFFSENWQNRRKV